MSISTRKGASLKIANVVPSGGLLLLDPAETYHLTLAEVASRSDTYVDFYRRRTAGGDFTILDNGAYEYGKTPDLELLIEVAKAMRPSEVVLPDDMHGPNCHQETVAMSRDAIPHLQAAGFRNFMAVPHGHTFSDWKWCAQALLQLDGVRCLGIAEKDALKLMDGARSALVTTLLDLGAPAVHLLGMMESMEDVLNPWVRKVVRGVDGSKLFVWGMNGCGAHPNRPLPKYRGRPPGYLDLPYTRFGEAAPLICENIRAWRWLVENR